MSEFRLVSAPTTSELYRQIGFDADVEAAGFRRLAELRLQRCRRAFGRLVGGLDFGALPGTDQQNVSLLLLDVLQQVNRRVHRATSDDQAYQAHRVALIERFAGLRDAEDARQAFMPTLNMLLARLGPRSATAPALVDRAQAYIEENYHRRISLSSVAERVHASPNYLSRVFKRETGMTLTHYTHAVRLEHATLLLAGAERTISEIAYLVGYQNYRDFYRNFVKYKNVSPRTLRNRLNPGRARPAAPLPAEGAS